MVAYPAELSRASCSWKFEQRSSNLTVCKFTIARVADAAVRRVKGGGRGGHGAEHDIC